MECGSGASAYAEASLQHSKQVSAGLTPLPQRGEGLGVRAKKRAHPAHSEPKRCTLISPTPISREAVEGAIDEL